MSWQTDLAALVPGMDRLHPALDHGVTLDALNSAAADLAADTPGLTDDQLLDGTMRIVALVSSKGCDAHTGAYVWSNGNYPVDSLPLRLWLFDEGVYIVDVLDPYRQLIGSRIEMIGGVPIADVMAAVEAPIPRDNEWTIRNLTPRYLLVPRSVEDGRVAVVAGAGRRHPVRPIQPDALCQLPAQRPW